MAFRNIFFKRPSVPKLKEVNWGKIINVKEDTGIKPFQITVAENILEDLKYRLKGASIPNPIPNTKQQYGFDGDTLRKIIHHWLSDYDWNKRKEYLNQFPQFKTNIQGLDVHYIHIKPSNLGPHISVYPLMIIHGSGSSIREFYDVIPLLTSNRKGYNFAFELIVPSIPGFAFSEASEKPGLSISAISQILKNLMQKLGHKKFYLHGGDLGAMISTSLSTIFPDNILGLHLTLPLIYGKKSILNYILNSTFPINMIGKLQEIIYPTSFAKNFIPEERGYVKIQATKPDTIGIALTDSPIGLAAYILEKFSATADDDLLERYTYDKLIDNLMIYWISKCITSACRIYFDSFSENELSLELRNIPIDPKIPCAVAKFSNVYLPDFVLKDKFKTLIQSTRHKKCRRYPAFENDAGETFAEEIFSSIYEMIRFHQAAVPVKPVT